MSSSEEEKEYYNNDKDYADDYDDDSDEEEVEYVEESGEEEEYEVQETSKKKADPASYQSKQKSNRWEELYNLNKKQLEVKRMVEEYKKEEDRKLDAECTFQPKINKKTRELYNDNDTGNLYQKNLKWEREKEKKLKKRMEMKKERDLEGCTFRPNIGKKKKVVRKKVPVKNNKAEEEMRKFIERQKKAREKHLEKKVALEMGKNLNMDSLRIKKTEKKGTREQVKPEFIKKNLEGKSFEVCVENLHQFLQNLNVYNN